MQIRYAKKKGSHQKDVTVLHKLNMKKQSPEMPHGATDIGYKKVVTGMMERCSTQIRFEKVVTVMMAQSYTN